MFDVIYGRLLIEYGGQLIEIGTYITNKTVLAINRIQKVNFQFILLQGIELFACGVAWLILNAGAIFLCMWIKLKVRTLRTNIKLNYHHYLAPQSTVCL